MLFSISRFARLQEKISKAATILEFFTTHDWTYEFQNILNIEKEMSESDRKTFNIDVKEVDWKLYMDNYCLGIKRFLLKEDMSKVKNYERSADKK
jgi:fatty acyl-CoA reductase